MILAFSEKNGLIEVPQFRANSLAYQKKDESSSPKKDEANIPKFGNVAGWGDDNLYPQRVYKAAENNTIVPSTIERKVELLVSGGWEYGIPDYDSEGKPVFKWKKNAELERFLKASNFDQYLMEAASDLYWFYHPFPEVYVNQNTRKITGFSAQEATFSRWSVQNKYGIIEKCYINANWENTQSEDDQYTLTRDVLNRYGDPAQDLYDRKSGTHFIYPLYYSTPGKVYYQVASWHSAIWGHWLGISNAIAEFKKFCMENGITLRYLIYIDEEYWPKRYPDWGKLSKEERDEKVRETKEEIEKMLLGVKNAQKTLFVNKEFMPGAKDERKYITIEPVKTDTLSGDLIPESQEAASHLLYALGLPYTLLGNSVGKGAQGAGSGSDVFEHLRLYLYRCRSHITLLLEPFNRLILPYMGWGDYEIRLRQPVLEMRANITPSERNTQQPANEQA